MDVGEIERALDSMGVRVPYRLGLVFEFDEVDEERWRAYQWNPPAGRRAADRKASPKPEWAELEVVAVVLAVRAARDAKLDELWLATERRISEVYVPAPAAERAGHPRHAEAQFRAELYFRAMATPAELAPLNARAAKIRERYNAIVQAINGAGSMEALARFDVARALAAGPAAFNKSVKLLISG